jgi:copper chaperone CopZ
LFRWTNESIAPQDPEFLVGAARVDVSFEKQSATVTYDADKVGVEQMIQAINQAGFRASLARSE